MRGYCLGEVRDVRVGVREERSVDSLLFEKSLELTKFHGVGREGGYLNVVVEQMYINSEIILFLCKKWCCRTD